MSRERIPKSSIDVGRCKILGINDIDDSYKLFYKEFYRFILNLNIKYARKFRSQIERDPFLDHLISLISEVGLACKKERVNLDTFDFHLDTESNYKEHEPAFPTINIKIKELIKDPNTYFEVGVDDFDSILPHPDRYYPLKCGDILFMRIHRQDHSSSDSETIANSNYFYSLVSKKHFQSLQHKAKIK